MTALPSSVVPPGLAWRLEAFDLRAGLAFATFRSEQTDAQEVEDWPCLFVSPPDFAPQPIDNVPAALAATRGSFDAGLIVNDQESAFKTPEDVAEFVRRAYVSSASGDGSDSPGGGGGPMPPSPEGPRDPVLQLPVEEKGDTDSNACEYLRGAIQDFERDIRGSKQAASFSADWSRIRDADAVDSIGRGALIVVLELLDRFPGTHATDVLRWLEDIRLLGDCVSKLGLWQLILAKHEAALSNRLRMLRQRVGWPWIHRVDDGELLAFLFASRALPDAPEEALHWLHFPPPYLIAALPAARANWSDPLDLLGRMPLPNFALAMVPSDSTERASLEHLLVGFVATPWTLMQLQDRESRATLDVLIFAATCIAGLGVSTATPHYLAWTTQGMSNLRTQVIRQAGARGLDWLAEQLPARGFSAPLEDRILEARDIRYVDGEPSSTAPGPIGANG